jgi:hypothetical protein
LICRTLDDFRGDDNNREFAKIRLDHYDKRRSAKMKQITEFVKALKGKNKKQGILFNQLPKESLNELKKSKGKEYLVIR